MSLRCPEQRTSIERCLFVSEGASRAETVLRRRWKHVELIAAALVEQSRLTGADVAAILAP